MAGVNKAEKVKQLRNGYTTGTCAAAAAKAATELLLKGSVKQSIAVCLAENVCVNIPLVYARIIGQSAEAAVKKDAGDDPDVTNGVMVVASVCRHPGDDVLFQAGDGVGRVTKPGLALEPGQPAINPGPRLLITNAVRDITPEGIIVTISIPGGEEIAKKTFNPRLGIEGGLSILGTTGIVRPFSSSAIRESLKCAVDVAYAAGIRAPVLVPGHIGETAAKNNFPVADDQIIAVSNEWGFMLDYAAQYDFTRMLILGHPGKLAKLIKNDWDTHSARSGSAVPIIEEVAGRVLKRKAVESTTAEGIFAELSPGESKTLGIALAQSIQEAITARMKNKLRIAVVLIDLKRNIIGTYGELQAWREKN